MHPPAMLVFLSSILGLGAAWIHRAREGGRNENVLSNQQKKQLWNRRQAQTVITKGLEVEKVTYGKRNKT